MPLLKNGAVAEDQWVKVADDAPLPQTQPALMSHARWQAEKDDLSRRNAPLGIVLPNDLDILTFGPEAGRFGLIVLNFPKFSDGRAYSQARLLRERFGYRGELRAVGDVLRDQLLLMHRAGFDAYEIARPDAAEIFAKALQTFSAYYQPTGSSPLTILQRRLQQSRHQEAAE
ncbi:MAG TPA: DUF934 domain-containing protein [Ferrovibrio sp.]|jgi:uncharacterized protein (DUF934 family)|uniref:DUF934 domain-containing protein n=1 Tax=Ferrovibrio sp. TaxID=1917215 RepID=UPI002ED63408